MTEEFPTIDNEIHKEHLKRMKKVLKGERYQVDEWSDYLSSVYNKSHQFCNGDCICDNASITTLSSEEICNLLNDKTNLIKFYERIIDWIAQNPNGTEYIKFRSRDEFFIFLKEKGVIE